MKYRLEDMTFLEFRDRMAEDPVIIPPLGSQEFKGLGHVPIDITDHCDYVTDGDPSLANAAAGKLFADYIVDTASNLVDHLKTAPVRVAANQARR